tara:strand:+ start:3214 stop:3915 length:702 start_codon:yes stop_codon:yes gene_type:complete
MSDQESDTSPHPTDSENSSSSENEDIISDSECSISDDDLEEEEVEGIDENNCIQKGGAGNKKISISDQSLPLPIPDHSLKLPLLTEDDVALDADTESEEEDDEDDEDVDNLAKFDEETRQNHLMAHHPQAMLPSFEEVRSFSNVTRDNDGNPVDPLHRTVPILTKYERTRIIGLRASQLANGAPPYIKLSNPIINELIIAKMELDAGVLPFVIRRPLPNGGSEYWKLADLAIV